MDELDNRVSELELEAELIESLPHKFGFKFYEWAWDFYTSRNKVCLLTAGNQLSKSSTQIRKVIEWATNKELWPKLWRTQPKNFVYLYPSMEVSTVEVMTKWVPEFLPRGKYKEHPVFGWSIVTNATKKVTAIKFNSGVTVHFKSYEQSASNLQTITAYYIAADEEIPEQLFDEIMFRIAGVDGYFSAVFTATRGQEFWKNCMEDVGTRLEKLPDAWKRQVSAYDCLQYMDGTDSPWTVKRIKQLEARCKNEQEILKRVHGRFVRDDGLRYVFSKDRHHKPSPEGFSGIPRPEFTVYSGVDYASGNAKGRSAVVFGELSKNMRQVRIFKCWRADGEITTAGDLYNKYILLRNFSVTAAAYDHGARDFFEIASRNGEPFFKADKRRDHGDELINTLLKFNLITFDTGDDELDKLCIELMSLSKDDVHNDDLADALRYCIAVMPIDWQAIRPVEDTPEKIAVMSELDLRRKGLVTDTIVKIDDDMQAEMNAWAEEFGNG